MFVLLVIAYFSTGKMVVMTMPSLEACQVEVSQLRSAGDTADMRCIPIEPQVHL